MALIFLHLLYLFPWEDKQKKSMKYLVFYAFILLNRDGSLSRSISTLIELSRHRQMCHVMRKGNLFLYELWHISRFMQESRTFFIDLLRK